MLLLSTPYLAVPISATVPFATAHWHCCQTADIAWRKTLPGIRLSLYNLPAWLSACSQQGSYVAFGLTKLEVVQKTAFGKAKQLCLSSKAIQVIYVDVDVEKRFRTS